MGLLEPIRKEMEILHFLALSIKIQMPYNLTLYIYGKQNLRTSKHWKEEH